VLLGYGTIGKCVFDILTLDSEFLKDVLGYDLSKHNIVIIDKTLPKDHFQQLRNVQAIQFSLKKENLTQLFNSIQLIKGDIVVDLTSCTGTRDIIKKVSVDLGANYICTALEGWNGWMYEMPKMVSHIATLKKSLPPGSPTVLLTHGMNPGMVSHFALMGLGIVGKGKAKDLKILHITETDTQTIADAEKRGLPIAVPRLTVTRPLMPKNIISTWGPQNFVDEMNALPMYVTNGKISKGRNRAYRNVIPSFIYNADTGKIETYEGHIVTHEESFTLNNHLKTQFGSKSDIAFVYKPTDQSLKSFLKKGCKMKPGERKGLLLKGENVVGVDTVGVYMSFLDGDQLWIGNACRAGYAPTEQLRKRFHNATTMQVAAGVLSGLWVISKAPNMGMLFPEEIPDQLRKGLLQISERYYGQIVIKRAQN